MKMESIQGLYQDNQQFKNTDHVNSTLPLRKSHPTPHVPQISAIIQVLYCSSFLQAHPPQVRKQETLNE